MMESTNWELAEDERELQRTRDRQIEASHDRRRRLTAALADQRRDKLQRSRELHRRLVDRVGSEAKAYSDDCRRQTLDARSAWEQTARALPRAQQNNERARRQVERVHAERAAVVAARTADRLRAEHEQQEEAAERQRATRARAEANRRGAMLKIRASADQERLQREATVDGMRDLATSRESARVETKRQHLEANRSTHDGVAQRLAPENVREFKAREQARKHESSSRLRAQSGRGRETFDAWRRSDEDRKRAVHDAVRRSELGGFCDRRRTAYSSYRHSGTSNFSHSREEGAHRFRHDLPSARSPAGRWLRDYGATYVQAKRERESVSGSVVSV
jgi:hypothetical protein